MKLSKDNDHLTISEFYEIHFNDLFNYARSITNSYDTAKDAISDVFLYLIQSKVDLNYVKNVKGYLLKSVKNSCIKLLTKNPQNLEYLQHDLEYQIAEEMNPQNILLGKELDDFIFRAISNLPPKAQLVFEMVRLHGKTHEEVSLELGISINTVRNHLASALKNIREQLEISYRENPKLGYGSELGIVVLALINSVEYFQ